ncbi:hypothetical protein FNW25_08230 [Flavobacterium franklandianum]|uniref:hypothetical protein n=1 Tax=Flavobacterium franklandianum TaxID=2594430 RepID=UPI00117A7A8A|nr:hypothetical protein [Flavobacterium franklandianum]TRX26599.1 hypothetical protein FNW25_08230 [Flavobacterium franklandianum]
MVQKLRIQKGFRIFLVIFTLIFNGISLYAQDQLDDNFKKNADKYYNIEYQIPINYHGIDVEHFPLYFSDEKYIRSSFSNGIKNDKLNIVVTFSLIIAKPLETPRSKRARDILGDPSIINPEAIINQADTTLSKVKYLDTLQLKKVNTNRGVIYNMKIDNKYMDIYTRCKKIELYKDNVGRVEIFFFYNKGDDVLIDEEIEKTWGMLKFK